LNELGENVGLVVHYQAVHYQKVQENGAFNKNRVFPNGNAKKLLFML